MGSDVCVRVLCVGVLCAVCVWTGCGWVGVGVGGWVSVREFWWSGGDQGWVVRSTCS